MRRTTLRTIAIPLALLTAAALVGDPATAAKKKKKPVTVTKTVTRYYEAPGERLTSRIVLRSDPTCGPEGCSVAGDGTYEAGGVSFDPTAKAGTKKYKTVVVRLWDDVDWMGQVAVLVCDSIVRTACQGSTFSQYACLTRGQPMTIRGTPRVNHIVVLVYAAWSCTQFVNDLPDSQGAAVTGKVTAKFTWVK
jgi:hypothetical protein